MLARAQPAGSQPSPLYLLESNVTAAPMTAVEDGPPTGSLAATSGRDAELARLQAATLEPFSTLQGRFGIAVKDLGSGLAVYQNEREVFQAASLYKLPVMVEVFKQREEGQLSFDELLTVRFEDAEEDLGTLIWRVGDVVPLDTALERMITVSDNTSAVMLLRRVGSAHVNEDMKALGLEQTTITSEALTTSALDMARLLELIAEGRLVSPSSSAEMVHILLRQQVRNRIPALLPPEATVGNKTGNWDEAAHDVAIVYTPRSTFVAAFLSDGNPDLDAVYTAMATAARNIYELTNDPSFATVPQPTLPPWPTSATTSERSSPDAEARNDNALRPAPDDTDNGNRAVRRRS